MKTDDVREGSSGLSGRCGSCGFLRALRTLRGEETGAQGEAEIQDLLGAGGEGRQGPVRNRTEAGRSRERGQGFLDVVDDVLVLLLLLDRVAEIHLARGG